MQFGGRSGEMNNHNSSSSSSSIPNNNIEPLLETPNVFTKGKQSFNSNSNMMQVEDEDMKFG